MNEPAIRLEEQIINLFPKKEMQICGGWILIKSEGCLFVYPLYYRFSEKNIQDNIRKCEEIGRQNGSECVFRIVEHTNYYLSALLTDTGYILQKCGVVGELHLAESANHIGTEKQELLFLHGENQPKDTELEDVLQFSIKNGITQILADIPEWEKLPEQYERVGFRKAYLYRCYQKRTYSNSNGCNVY